MLSERPEFGYVRAQSGADVEGLINELRVRQNDEGAYKLWPGGNDVVEFVSVYAQHFLIEASESWAACSSGSRETGKHASDRSGPPRRQQYRRGAQLGVRDLPAHASG